MTKEEARQAFIEKCYSKNGDLGYCAEEGFLIRFCESCGKPALPYWKCENCGAEK